ncbi:MAG TPA: hypothetical protein VGG69_01685 [Rhizomicrobium sp.]
MAIIAIGLLALLMLISGVHLFAREIGHSAKRRRRSRRAGATAHKGHDREQLYAGAGD